MRWLALLGLLGPLAACASAEEEFTQGRLEALCDGAIPICRLRAGCVLGDDTFARGRFPGAQQVIVRSPVDAAELQVRLLLTDLVHPGTELLVQVHGLGLRHPGAGPAGGRRIPPGRRRRHPRVHAASDRARRPPAQRSTPTSAAYVVTA
ncbi:MAG: hypothetical protein R3F60_22705 [bacterium]